MEAYISPEYEPTSPILSFRAVPRFGRSDEITDIFTDDGSVDWEKVSEYAMGTIFVAAFLLATYILFVLVVIILKFCIGKRAGILAGYPFLEDKSLIFDKPRKNAFFRSSILLLISIIIAGGLVFLTKGTQQVRAVASDVRDGTDGFSTISHKVVDTADLMIQFGENSVPLRNTLMGMIDEGLCKSFEGGNANPEEEFDAAAKTLVAVLAELQDFAKNDLTDIRDTFDTDVLAIGHQIGNTTDTAAILANPAYYAGPTIALGFVLLIGLILAWLETTLPVYFCIQTWIFMPLFFMLITVSIVVITIVGAVLVANSDFCIGNAEGTPEGTVKVIFELFDFDEKTSAALDYYILDGCRGEYNQLIAVEDLLLQLDDGTKAAKDLDELVTQNKEQFEDLCGGGVGSLDSLQDTIGLALEAFEDVMEIGDRTTDVLTCEGINSIWVDIVHDAVCTSAPSAFGWMFASITCVYVSGIFIYLQRGALLPSFDIDGSASFEDDSSGYTPDEIF